MFKKRFYYILKIQYLGFRYHGWQKQPGQITVERMIQRTLQYVLQRKNFKLLAAGRTDAKVSVNETFVELFIEEKPLELDDFLKVVNQNLPQDIRALEISETDAEFNIIQHPKVKEYIYLFSFDTKNHPFCAPFLVYIPEKLDIPLMQEAAKLMEGKHDFLNFTYKPKPETKTIMHIDTCEIVPNTLFTANFFPEKTYMLRVCGAGFKRHQIRLMMGALSEVGARVMSMDHFQKLLAAEKNFNFTHMAKPSGLILNKVTLSSKKII